MIFYLKKAKTLSVLAFVFFASLLPGAAKEDYLSLQNRLMSVYDQNRKAIVRIIASYEKEGESGDAPFLLVGTGFFISKEGHVMTNATVVNRPNRIWVDHEGTSYEAELVGFDSVTNLSIIRLKELPEEFTFLHLADGSDALPGVGTMLFSISCELGFDPSPSMGLLTGQNIHYGDQVLPTTYLRTDIPSDGGEGGAPVFDIHGRLIGMVVVSLPEIRSSFILPTKAARRVRDDILFSGQVNYGYLGVRINPESVGRLNPYLEIEEVLEGSPAKEAGVQNKDILLKVGDYNVKNLPDLHNATFFSIPGHYLPLEVLRDGEVKQFSIKVGEYPVEATQVAVEEEFSEMLDDDASALTISALDESLAFGEELTPDILDAPLLDSAEKVH